MTSRPYKDLIIYGCFVLNRLVAEMGIDLYQEGLDAKLALVLPNQRGLSKEEGKREIKSNHFMTDRVIESLEKEGHATVEVVDDDRDKGVGSIISLDREFQRAHEG